MTATVTGGDAIGNYIAMMRDAFAPRYEFALFADRGTPDRKFLPSYSYVPTASDILWFHYSIWSENFAALRPGPDYKIMDFHGVCPSEHFTDDELDLKKFSDRALEQLPDFRNIFDLCIVHSDYSEKVLREVGYTQIVKSPLAIGSALAEAREDPFLDDRLSQLEYLLFVGRVVAQKDVLGAIELYARLRAKRPALKMWIVGDRTASPQYQHRIAERLAELDIERDVGFTGRLSDPTLLKPFFKNARLLVMYSRWETFCVPIVEAMGFGVPTVTTEQTCVPEIMGGTGLIVDRDNLGDAVRRVAGILWNNDIYGKARKRCIERAPQFTQKAMSERLFQIEREHFPKKGQQ